MSPDRNDPETAAYLELCRNWGARLPPEEFEALIPDFIELANWMEKLRSVNQVH